MKTIKISSIIFLIILIFSHTLKADKEPELLNLLEHMNKKYSKLNHVHKSTRIRKGLIEGPFGKGDPVHEILTSIALSKYNPNVYSEYYHLLSLSHYEYIRGVIWNDDPESFLFDEKIKSNRNMSTGIDWIIEYCQVMYQLESKKTLNFNQNELTKRSHFGDLQFFHAMASYDNEPTIKTKKNIYSWLNFLYFIISSTNINNNTKLQNIKHPFIKKYFKGLENLSLNKLFGKKSYINFNIKKRAIGSFLHVIQDSYFSGHVERVNKTRKVIRFLSYANQDTDEHARHDQLNSSILTRLLHNEVFLVKLLAQSERITDVSVKLLHMLKPLNGEKSATWNDIKYYLDKEVFTTIDKPKVSSAGERFHRKKKEETMPKYCLKWYFKLID